MTQATDRETRRCRVCDKTKSADCFSHRKRTCKVCYAKIEKKADSIKTRRDAWIALVNLPIAGK